MCVWVEDADAIQMNEKALEIVYKNTRVRSFLYSSKMLGVSGIKGQGKTFLLKVKRSMAEKDESVCCFPKDLMVDQLDNSTIINRSIFKFMDDFNNWVTIWKVAIALTIIKANMCDVKIGKEFKSAQNTIKELLEVRNSKYRTSVYVNHLLQLNRKELKEVLDCTSNLLEKLYDIHSAIYIFIDKVDQAFSKDIHPIYGDSKMSRGPQNASYWQYCQYALAQVSYDINTNINRHIKVYYSIRQEALIDTNKITPNLKRNIESYIVNLDYSKYDLKQMFYQYIESEDEENLNSSNLRKTNPTKAFLGTDIILNRYINQEEDAFDYIYRHSLKRPADIMKICKKLSLDNRAYDIIKIRKTVNNCAGEILNTYIKELEPFLPYDIEALFMHININILDINYIKYVCNRFTNQQNHLFPCPRNCKRCLSIQPFVVLFNIGLLGYLKKDITNNRYVQQFTSVGESVFLENIQYFPKSDYYFVHPCLMDVIRKRRDEYSLLHYTDDNQIVGDDYGFDEFYKGAIDVEIKQAMNQLKKEDVFVSSTIDDLHEERSIIRKVLTNRGYNVIMSEENDFPINGETLGKVHSHDYCIDKLLECGNIIFVIGKSYGGVYAGQKYNCLKNEIIAKSKGKIKNPSISLMEFYAAIKNGINHYAFIAEEFDKTKNIENVWDERIIIEYNFLNHLEKEENEFVNDNWISRYELKGDDFKSRLRNIVLS